MNIKSQLLEQNTGIKYHKFIFMLFALAMFCYSQLAKANGFSDGISSEG